MLSLVLLHSPAALAWESYGATWPAEAFPIPYSVATDLGDDVDDAAALAAVQAAFDSWAAVECAGVTFTYAGRVDDAVFNAADGQNVVFLFTESWPGEASLISMPGFSQDGTTLTDVDIALNGRDYAWATEGADGRTVMDVQSSVAHEIGHLLGLWHSTVEGATLNPALDGNPDARSLEQDDIDGLCSLYDLVRGDGAVGDTCVETSDCAGEGFCLADGGERYCSVECTTAAECPEGFECLPAGDADVCARAVEEATGCGCASGGSAGSGAAGLASLVVLWGLARFRARG